MRRFAWRLPAPRHHHSNPPSLLHRIPCPLPCDGAAAMARGASWHPPSVSSLHPLRIFQSLHSLLLLLGHPLELRPPPHCSPHPRLGLPTPAHNLANLGRLRCRTRSTSW